MAKLNADLLDDITIKAAKPTEKQYTLRDGNGLFLLIHPMSVNTSTCAITAQTLGFVDGARVNTATG